LWAIICESTVFKITFNENDNPMDKKKEVPIELKFAISKEVPYVLKELK
jgi:hypothetical protein